MKATVAPISSDFSKYTAKGSESVIDVPLPTAVAITYDEN